MKLEDIKTIAVIGAGLIGQATAVEFTLGGYDVRLNSRSEESLQRGLQEIRGILDTMVGLGIATTGDANLAVTRIKSDVSLKSTVEDAQVIFEAVYEDLELKQRIFRDLDRYRQLDALMVSGTSTLRLSDIASATTSPELVVLANYSNPTYLVPLVEVLRNDKTSDETVDTLCALLTRIGKRPVVIQKDVPGFVANRLQVALLREALHLIEQGIVTAQDIDLIMRSSIGRRWAVAGIFEVFDIAGHDLTLSASSYLMPYLDNSTEPSPVLRDKVARGELGIKTGKGFYDWTPETADALRQRIAHALVEIEKWSQGD